MGACVAAANAAPSPFTEEDAARLVATLKSLPAPSDVAATHHLHGALSRLNSKGAEVGAACEQVKRALEGQDLRSIYHAASVSQILGCHSKMSDSLKKSLQAALDGDDLLQASWAAHAIAALSKGSGGFDFKRAVSTALSLQLENGSFRQYKLQTETPSIFTSALAFELLAITQPTCDEALKSRIKSAFTKFDTFIELGTRHKDVVSFPGDAHNSGVATAGVVLRSLFALSDLSPKSVELSQVYLSVFLSRILLLLPPLWGRRSIFCFVPNRTRYMFSFLLLFLTYCIACVNRSHCSF